MSLPQARLVSANRDGAPLLGWPRPGAAPSWMLVTLSEIEREILSDAAAGMTMVESAARRRKATETVKSQRKHLMLKLGARNMTQAVAVALRDGLIPGPPRAG